MSIDDIKYNAGFTKKTVEQGARAIAAIKATVPQLLPTGLISIVRETPYSLEVSVYGARFIFRIETVWGKTEPARLAAFAIKPGPNSYEDPLGLVYTIDDLGNVNRCHTVDEFAPNFLRDFFEALKNKEIVLRP